jgi:hypothetical protein
MQCRKAYEAESLHLYEASALLPCVISLLPASAGFFLPKESIMPCGKGYGKKGGMGKGKGGGKKK